MTEKNVKKKVLICDEEEAIRILLKEVLDDFWEVTTTADGRELRMIELKEEINELDRCLSESPRHATDPLQTDSVPGAGPAPVPPDGGGA
jgi:CheY-like chemotaxis protein